MGDGRPVSAGADTAAARGRRRGRGEGDAAGGSDGHLGQSHVDGHRRAAGEARRHLQRPADPRAGSGASRRTVARQEGAGARAHGLRRRARARPDHRAGGLGRDPECADRSPGNFQSAPIPKGAIAQEAVKAGILSQADLEAFATRNILWRDHIWTQAAAHILRQHRPNLLLFHLLNLDSTQHRYGPRTPAAMAAMAHLDSQVATIVDTLEKTGLMPRTTLFVVSDHGFKAVKRQIRPNAAFVKAGFITVEGGKTTSARVYSYPEGGTALVYVTVPDPAGALLATGQSVTGRLGGNRLDHRGRRVRQVRAAAADRDRPDGRAPADRERGIRVHRRCRRTGGRGRASRPASARTAISPAIPICAPCSSPPAAASGQARPSSRYRTSISRRRSRACSASQLPDAQGKVLTEMLTGK